MTSPTNLAAEAVPVTGEPEVEEADGRKKKHRRRRKSRSKRRSSAGRASDASEYGDNAASVPGTTAPTSTEPAIPVPAGESTSTFAPTLPESADMTPGEVGALPPQPSALKLEENTHLAQLALSTDAAHPPGRQITATLQGAAENQTAAVSRDMGPKGSTDLGRARRGSTPESLRLAHPVPSPSSSKRSDTANKATNTASWFELSRTVASSSDTSEKYTQTGDIVMYPSTSASGRRRPQVEKSVATPKFEHDGSEWEDSWTASSGISSQPPFQEQIDYSEDIMQIQIPEALRQDYDSESMCELSGSEGALSFLLALNEKGSRETRALPGLKNRAFARTVAGPPGGATQSAKKKGRTEPVRQDHSGFDRRRKPGRVSKASVKTNAATPDDASLLDVVASDDEDVYEEIPVERQTNESGSSVCSSDSSEVLNMPHKTGERHKTAAEMGFQRGIENRKQNRKVSQMHTRKQRNAPGSNLGSVEDEVGIDQSDVTRAALPTSMNGNQQETCDVFSLGVDTDRINDQDNECDKLIHPQPLQGNSATRRTTDGKKARDTLTNESACVHCAHNRTAISEALTQRDRYKSGANNSENYASQLGTTKTPQIYANSDPRLYLPPYKVGRRPTGCICNGIEYLPQRLFSYALPNSYLQYRQCTRVGQVQPTSAVQGPSRIFSGQRLLDTAANKSKPGHKIIRDSSLGGGPPYIRNINFQAITRRRPPMSTKVSNDDVKEDAKETMTSGLRRSKETSLGLPYYSTNDADKGRRSRTNSPRTRERNDRTSQALKKASAAQSCSVCKVHHIKPPDNSKQNICKESVGLKAKSTKHRALSSKPLGRSSRCSPCECGKQGHHCDNGGNCHGYCRPGRILDPRPSRPEDSGPALGHSAALARLEHLLRDETHLLKEEKERHEERLRLERLVKEHERLLSELKCDASKEGREIQDALSLHTEAVAKAFAFLNQEPSAGVGAVGGHQATKGAVSATKQSKAAPTGKEDSASQLKTTKSSSSSSRKSVRKADAGSGSSKHDVQHKNI